MEKEQKEKVGYSRWFLIILAIVLYTVITQLYALTTWLPGNWANFTLWSKIFASSIAAFGVVWIIRMYLKNTKRQFKRKLKIRQAIIDHPELAEVLKDILGEE